MTKLLYVDDSPDVLRLSAAILGFQGFAVTTCISPREALMKLRSQAFDAIITDYDMPDMNGISFAKRVRSEGYDGPIILCTGSPDIDTETIPGIDAIVRKGLHPLVLGVRLHECIAGVAV